MRSGQSKPTWKNGLVAQATRSSDTTHVRTAFFAAKFYSTASMVVIVVQYNQRLCRHGIVAPCIICRRFDSARDALGPRPQCPCDSDCYLFRQLCPLRASLPPSDADALYALREGWPRVPRLIAGAHASSLLSGNDAVSSRLSSLLFSHPRTLLSHGVGVQNSRDKAVLQELARRAQCMVQQRIAVLQGQVSRFVLGRAEEERVSRMRVHALSARLELINLAEFRPGGASCARAVELRRAIVRAETRADVHEARKQARVARLAVDALIIFSRERGVEALAVPKLCTALWREEVVWNALSRVYSKSTRRTALMYAALKHDVVTVDFLLKRGARVDAADIYSNHALSYAVQHFEPPPHLEFFRDGGFNSGAWVEGYNGRGRPPLCRQCVHTKCACPREDGGDSVRAVVRLLITALKRDKRVSADAVVKLYSRKALICGGSRQYHPTSLPLAGIAIILAERTGNTAALREIVEEHLTPSLAPLLFKTAASRGRLDVIELLLSRGFAPTHDALRAAAGLGFVEVALALVRGGVNADAAVRESVEREFVNRATSKALARVRAAAVAEFEQLWPASNGGT